ncbi:unnamed protein product [Victoria cruziana]
MGQASSSSCSSVSPSCSATTPPATDGESTNADHTLLLPDECLATIFSKLGCEDRNASSLVCRRWKNVESKCRQRLILRARSDLSPFLPHLLLRFENVSTLALKCSRKLISLDDRALVRIASGLPRLKKLKLKGCVEITDDGLRSFSLSCSPSLKKFSCGSCGFGVRGLNWVVSNCKGLEDLSVKRLRKLNLQSQAQAVNMELENGLQRLCLKDLHNGRLFSPLIRSSKRLRTLIVCRSSGDWDRIFEESADALTELTELQIDNVQMGDWGLSAVAKCRSLEVLFISRATDCSDAGISAVANGCRKLRKIHLDGCKFNRIGDNGLASIAAKCSDLQEILLMEVAVSAAGLNSLAENCRNLERMALCNTDSVGDAEMLCVAEKFGALRKLCVKNCPITDSGIEVIGWGCPNLIKLKVKRCKSVTKASICWLKLHRRGLVVSMDAGSMTGGREEEAAAEEGVDSGGHGTRSRRITSSATHLVCGSKGTTVLRSKLSNAASVLLVKRGSGSSSTSHSAHR